MRAVYQTFNRAAEEAERARQAAASDPRSFLQTDFSDGPPPVPGTGQSPVGRA